MDRIAECTKMSHFYVSSKSLVAAICKNSDGKFMVKKFKVDFERKQLMETDDLCWNTKMKVEILATDSVEETLTGQVIPVALVRPEEKSSTITCYIVCIDFDNDKVLPLRKYDTKLKYIQCVDEDHTCSDRNVFILNGPVVVVCYKSKLFIYHGDQTTILKEFCFDANTLTDSISVCCRQSKVSFRYQGLLESTTLHDKYILFLHIQVKLRCTEHGFEARNIVKVLQFSGKKFTVLNIRLFIPDEYVDCIRSMLLKCITHSDSDLYNYELYLGTSEGYIIHVKNGGLIWCCSLSEQYSVSCIKMSLGLDNDIGILAKTGDVWTEITNTFQVIFFCSKAF